MSYESVHKLFIMPDSSTPAIADIKFVIPLSPCLCTRSYVYSVSDWLHHLPQACMHAPSLF